MTQWAIEDGNISEANGTATNILSGLAKTWILFDGTGTVSVTNSLNVSSLTDDGVGTYTYSFSNNFSNSNFSEVTSSNQRHIRHRSASRGVGGSGVQTTDNSESVVDDAYGQASVYGDLA